jgi:iron-sulfur cluster repair protein YtfE (RIC family)
MHLPEAEADTRLRDEHAELDARFDDLCARARDGDWSDVDEVWDDFADDLEAHLAFEEEEVFPALAKDAPALVERLTAQHEMIRRRLTELGVEIQVHTVRADTLETFVDALRQHAALENEQLYPRLAP